MAVPSAYPSSLRERELKRGTVWDVRYRIGSAPKSTTFDTKVEAERWQKLLALVGPADALKQLDPDSNAAFNPKSLTSFREYTNHHVSMLVEPSEGTKRNYLRFLDNGLLTLADVPVGLIDERRLVSWVNDRLDQGIAAKTIKNEHSLISGVLGRAASDGVLPKNIAHGFKLPKVEKRPMTFLTPDEFKTILGLVPDTWKVHILTLAATGMRWGEFTALRPRDIDLGRRVISVNNAWNHVKADKANGIKGGWVLGRPKSARAYRDITIQDELVESIRPLVAATGRDGFVFSAKLGGPLRQAYFYENVWAPVRRLVNGIDAFPQTPPGKRSRIVRELQYITPLETPLGKFPRVHDLRHTHASWLIEQGLPLPVIQDRLGHESIQTTVDRYGHLSPEAREKARVVTGEVMAGMFS